MRHANTATLMLVLISLAAACSGSASDGPGSGGSASVTLDGATYEVRHVAIVIEPGEDAYFRIDGEPASNTGEDCVTGLAGGLGLYGELPSTVHQASDLEGQRLKVDFSGDGDDANFCFLGMDGLAGAENAWVTIDSVSGNEVKFSMIGTFKIYDENGEGPIKTATATGTAIVDTKS